jgi:hypothetical protein
MENKLKKFEFIIHVMIVDDSAYQKTYCVDTLDVLQSFNLA